ncbi:hypothetical protein V8V91_10710 [Algoriphagus halophilus]|uniref:hypothetical protein n=1 Tax=Algoriphagus halophilus TaxID=226505 RepID=UPI00358ED00D
MQYLSVKIRSAIFQVPDLKAAESTAVKQGYQNAVLEQFGSFKKSADFFLTQYNGKSFTPLNGREARFAYPSSLRSGRQTSGHKL